MSDYLCDRRLDTEEQTEDSFLLRGGNLSPTVGSKEHQAKGAGRQTGFLAGQLCDLDISDVDAVWDWLGSECVLPVGRV